MILLFQMAPFDGVIYLDNIESQSFWKSIRSMKHKE